MEFSLEQLEAFIAAIDKGSFSAAARSLGKAQSRVSTAIANLEIDLGVVLFDRTGKLPVLTEDGKELEGSVRDVLKQCRKMQNKADTISRTEQRHLRLIVEELVSPRIIGEVLADFYHQFPEVLVEVFWGAIGDVQEQLDAQNVDIGVAIPPFGVPNDKYSWRILAPLKFVPMISPKHPLAAKKNLEPEDVQGYVQIVATSLGGISEPSIGVLSDVLWSCEDSQLMIELVKRGVGWAWLGAQQTIELEKRNELQELDLAMSPDFADGAYCLLWRKDYPLRPAEEWLA